MFQTSVKTPLAWGSVESAYYQGLLDNEKRLEREKYNGEVSYSTNAKDLGKAATQISDSQLEGGVFRYPIPQSTSFDPETVFLNRYMKSKEKNIVDRERAENIDFNYGIDRMNNDAAYRQYYTSQPKLYEMYLNSWKQSNKIPAEMAKENYRGKKYVRK